MNGTLLLLAIEAVLGAGGMTFARSSDRGSKMVGGARRHPHGERRGRGGVSLPAAP
jgi:hypothetical protein